MVQLSAILIAALANAEYVEQGPNRISESAGDVLEAQLTTASQISITKPRQPSRPQPKTPNAPRRLKPISQGEDLTNSTGLVGTSETSRSITCLVGTMICDRACKSRFGDSGSAEFCVTRTGKQCDTDDSGCERGVCVGGECLTRRTTRDWMAEFNAYLAAN